MKGCDTLSPVTNQLQCFKVNGIQFVARYLRNVKPEEVRAICDAGLQIVSCAERGRPDTGSYFTKVAGIKDGEWAVKVAQSLGQPTGSAIYFTVDYGCPDKDHPAVIEYFKGVQESVAESGYQVGGYAPGAVLTKLLSQNLIKYAWLPNARSWREGFTAWNINQGAQTTLCGVQIDPDEARGDFGAWTLEAKKPMPTPQPLPSGQAYTVKAGDSWWAIAKALHVSMEALLQINKKTADAIIHPGDVLKVPAKG
jgi:hypothetical protein